MAVRELDVPAGASHELDNAVSLALEADGVLAGDVRPSWRVVDRNAHCVKVMALAWRDPGLSIMAQAAASAGFKVVAAYHAGPGLAAIAGRSGGSQGSWALAFQSGGAALVQCGANGPKLYRKFDLQVPGGDVSGLVGDVRRSLQAAGTSAVSQMLIYGPDESADGWVSALVSEGLRARAGKPCAGLDGSVPAHSGLYAALIGVILGHIGLADPGPNLLEPFTARRAARDVFVPVAMGAAIALAIGAMVLLTIRSGRRQAAAEAWISAQTPRYEQAMQKLEACSDAERRIAQLNAIIRSRRDYLEALRSIEERLPAGTRIRSLILEGDELVGLTGVTPSASQLIRALEGSGAIGQLRFVGPIRIVEDSGAYLEEFTLSGRLNAGKGASE